MDDDRFLINSVDLSSFVEDIKVTPAEAEAFEAANQRLFDLLGLERTVTISGTWSNFATPRFTCVLCEHARPMSDGFGSMSHPALGRISPVCSQCAVEWCDKR